MNRSLRDAGLYSGPPGVGNAMKPSLSIALAACLLAACGQTGALYLPDEGVTTPVEIRPAPPAEPPAPEPPEDDDEPGDGTATPPTPGN